MLYHLFRIETVSGDFYYNLIEGRSMVALQAFQQKVLVESSIALVFLLMTLILHCIH